MALIKTFQPAPLEETGFVAVSDTIYEGHHMIGVKVLGEDFRSVHSVMVLTDQEAQTLSELLNILLKKRRRHAH